MRMTELEASAESAPVVPTAGVLSRLAAWCYGHRRSVVVAWFAVLLAAVGGSSAMGSAYQDRLGGGPADSQKAQDLLRERFPERAGDTANVVFDATGPLTGEPARARVTGLVEQLRSLPHVANVVSPFDPGGAAQTSTADPTIGFAMIQFDEITDDLPEEDLERVVAAAEAANVEGFGVEVGGTPIAKVVKAEAGKGEIIGLIAAVVILLVAFGSVIAMGLPILTALVGVGVGFAAISFMSHGIVVPTYGPQVASMVGLGVGIDYALFIVTRYRQGLAEGRDPRAAVMRAYDTSGRAVVFAGSTVVISLLGMLLLGRDFVYGLAFGSILVVLLVLLSSLTLLPALLGFSGRAIDRFKIPGRHNAAAAPSGHGAWYRWSRVIQRRPWTAAGGAFVVLVVLALPVFSMQLLFTDAGNDPTSLTTRHAYDLLSEGFGPGSNGPLVIAVDLTNAPEAADAADQLAAQLRAVPDVAQVSPPQLNQRGDTAVITVVPRSSPQDHATEQLVHHLRDDVIPSATAGTGAHALLGGVTAAGINLSEDFSHRLVWVIVGVVVLSFVLLMAVFRSIAVPVKAALMNVLSIGAAYGVIVAVFQWGWLSGVFGVESTGPIDPWIPLMLFTILFGLSMDYEVFLLSRIREEWLRTGDNATSVADGLARTARVITAAAAIMVCVFGSFVVGDLRILQVFGLGLAVAVFVDATVVRMILVPATMELLGSANWWFPRWLDRVIPHLDVEGEPDEFDQQPETDDALVGAAQ
jgi:putative drug exporter of the RND superfamily